MADPLFSERAKAYLIMYPDDAHKRLGISKRAMQRYAAGGTTKDKDLRQKVIRRGLTAQKRQIYVGAYRTKQEKLQILIDKARTPKQKAKRQKEKDDNTRDFNKGTWQPKLKKENAKVNSRITFSDTKAPEQYENVIV